MIDQLLDNQMNHVSSAETCVLNVARRCRCSAPVAVTAVRARSEFKWRYDASETDPINSTADAVR